MASLPVFGWGPERIVVPIRLPATLADVTAGPIQDNSGNIYGNCLEFTPGYYPTGINVTTLAGWANDVAIFQPGVYYLNGNLTVGAARPFAMRGSEPSPPRRESCSIS